MAVYTVSRYEIRSDAVAQAEAAMRALADYVRAQLPGSSWTVYRDRRAPGRFVAVLRAEDAAAHARHQASGGAQAFAAAIAPLVIASDDGDYELVTSSDLQ